MIKGFEADQPEITVVTRSEEIVELNLIANDTSFIDFQLSSSGKKFAKSPWMIEITQISEMKITTHFSRSHVEAQLGLKN
jgi:hypothetical protein